MNSILRLSVAAAYSIRRRSLSHREVTSRFLDYFRDRQHVILPSSSLLAPPETNLVFTNSGMNQFVRILSGKDPPEYACVASVQDCVRVGGKHNDLPDVGKDGHHHTFFQMLGNWSFGAYSKAEACKSALDLLTNQYGLKQENLVITYLSESPGVPEDAETKNIWMELGIPPRNIQPRGLEDNFWEMGTTGPCGPCTEIHSMSNGELREIWNIVFIQYNRLIDGTLSPMPTTFVDTGMGLERICALLQGKSSNYDTDLFRPIISELEKISGIQYTGSWNRPEDIAFRVIADHSRLVTKALSQGILPDHRDAGNKMRRILRRASQACQTKLRVPPGTFGSLSYIAADILDIGEGLKEIKDIIDQDEKRYLSNLKKAVSIIVKNNPSTDVLSGTTAWSLYVHCGLTRDDIEDVCEERDIKAVDWESFERELAEFRLKSAGQTKSRRNCLAEHLEKVQLQNLSPTDKSMVYGNVFELKTEVLYSDQTDSVFVTRQTCFYPESGGQVSDKGTISCEDGSHSPMEIVLENGGFVFHFVDGPVPAVGSKVKLNVEQGKRFACTQHHTASHLLNAAIRKCHGDHIQQHGNFIDADRFSLDIISRNPVDVASVETELNSMIEADIGIDITEMPRSDALRDSEIKRLPNEIYPERVRLVRCGSVSQELCCGTHVRRTGDIPRVVILKSKSAGANIKSVLATATRSQEAIGNAERIDTGLRSLRESISSLDESASHSVVSEAMAEIRRLRLRLRDDLLPYLEVNRITDELQELERVLKRTLKKFDQLSAEKLRSLLEKQRTEEGQPTVACFEFDCSDKIFQSTVSRVGSEWRFIACMTDEVIHIQCDFPGDEGQAAARDWVLHVKENLGLTGEIPTPKTKATECRAKLGGNARCEQIESIARQFIETSRRIRE